MTGKDRIIWITRTAVFIAILVAWQAATTPLGQSMVTGCVVNLLLITSVMLCGVASGLAVGVLSPVMAKLIGIGPLWSIIPFIILGNITIMLVWHFVGNIKAKHRAVPMVAALISGAVAKFLVLYIGIVQVAIPFLLGLKEQQAAVVSAMFSLPQLFTALVGGTLAAVLLPVLQKALSRRPA